MERPDYGIDAPGVVRNLLLIGIVLLAAVWFLPVLTVGPVNFKLRPAAAATGSVCLLEGLLMLLYAKNGKFHHRDRMLNLLQWTGKEAVLDVGTGRGLLMIGAAKRLAAGKAIGIDVWNAADLSGNRAERTLRNAELEGVSNRVEVRNEDAVSMSFADASFDVVLSNLCLHNIPAAEKRDQACREIARVLKPGGTALISDYKNTSDYQRALQAAGLEATRSGMYIGRVFPPLRIVIAKKPPAGAVLSA